MSLPSGRVPTHEACLKATLDARSEAPESFEERREYSRPGSRAHERA